MTGRTGRVVIVGGGFGGLTAARALRKAPLEVVLIDRSNHHLFQPLLYQVAIAGLASTSIAVPIRSTLRRQENARVLLAEATAVDLPKRELHLRELSPLAFDHLVLAMGQRTNYFGHDEWARHSLGLKSLEEAQEIRSRVLLAFEAAERTPDLALRRRLLTFVVVGGGATGVELSGALAELSRFALARDFRSIDPRQARVILVEGGDRLLPAFAPQLSDAAREQLESMGVNVWLGTQVTGIEPGRVSLGGRETLEADTVLWAAGVRGRPLAKTLGVPLDRMGRVIVGPDCAVPGHPEVYVIGDAAHFEQDGQPLPGVAPVAMQQARFVAGAIRARREGRAVGTFRYVDKGIMATIGRRRAVAQTRRLRFTGFLAWLTWLLVHIFYLIDFRNRVVVLVEWIWNYVTYQRGARLITGREPPSDAAAPGGSP